MTGVTTSPDLSRNFLVYAYGPTVIINNNPYMLNSVSAWMINYKVILNVIHLYKAQK